jgi:hypothetical protein
MRKRITISTRAFTIALLVLSSMAGSTKLSAATLSLSQASSLQSALRTDIANAHGDIVAIETAITRALENAITTDGQDAAGLLASTVLTTAEAAGATGTEIGTALADASAAVAPASCRGNEGNAIPDCQTAAALIALVMANEGRSDERLAYQSTVTTLGFPKLALIAGGSASATSELAGTAPSFGPGAGFNGGTGVTFGGCLNPSCTKL